MYTVARGERFEMDVATILNLIDAGEYGLPEFQRGYVWSRGQVRRFMSSLYHGNPVGSLLIWVPEEVTDVRGGNYPAVGNIKLIIDGQQRLTTLYGITRDKPPRFFRGNENNIRNLYFHLDAEKGEEFEFYGPVKMKDNPRWVSVTKVLQEGAGKYFQTRIQKGELDYPDWDRLHDLEKIKEKVFHSETITKRNLDEVVNIFNEVNSGGTKLNAADLAMAKLSAQRPTAREEMEKSLRKWSDFGYSFDFNWLLRGITILVSGDARFSTGGARSGEVRELDSNSFAKGLFRFEKHINDLLLQIRANLGLDNSSVLRSEFTLLVLAYYLELNNGLRQGEVEIARILYWYVNTALWGRYSGTTEARLNQDLAILRETDMWQDQLSGLIDSLRSVRGTLKLSPEDFFGSRRDNRFYPLLYLLTRVRNARDLFKNIPLDMGLVGNPLELHHIFPKSRLYQLDRSQREVNTLANFAFLTKGSNRSIGNRWPADYLAEAEGRFPGVLASQWIPNEPDLWEPENYDRFLERRRQALTDDSNALLDTLASGRLPKGAMLPRQQDVTLPVRPVHITSDEEELELTECQEWMEENNLPRGESGYELVDETSEDLLATLDLAWPDGVQEGLGHPVALLIDEEDETLYAAQQFNFRFFTSLPDFKQYVKQTALAE